MEKKSILMVTGIFPKISETFVVDQVIETSNRGFAVSVLANNYELTHNYESEIKIFYLNLSKNKLIFKARFISSLIINLILSSKLLFLLIGDLFLRKIGLKDFVWLSLVIRKKKDLIKDDYDIIQGQHASLCNKVLLLKDYFFIDAKTIVYARGNDVTAEISNNLSKYIKALSRCDLIISVCDYLKNELIKLGIDSNKIITLYGGINLSNFMLKEVQVNNNKPIQFLSIGRLVAKKGFDDAIKAFDELNRLSKFVDWSYSIYGSGEEYNRLNQMIEDFNLTNKVFLKGAIKPESVPKVMFNRDIFISSNKTALDGGAEGIPNVIKEAMAIGLPVIATKHAGIPELIENGKTGFLVSEGNYKQLAVKILEVLYRDDLESIKTMAREKIETQFNLEKNICFLTEIYGEL